MLPKVTVVIPCFNQGHFLRTAVDSALAQTYEDVEIIVVDDGSLDDTATVARSYGSAITLVSQPNAGLSAARNKGILLAAGDFVQLLDADDALLPDAITSKIQHAAASDGVVAVRGGWEEFDVSGCQTTVVGSRHLGQDPFHALFDPLAVGPPTTYLVRRSAILEAGLFDPILRSCEDWDMWLRLSLSGGTILTAPQTVARYRNHAESMSKNHRRMWHSGKRVLARAAARHGCRRCRLAFRSGVQEWRRYCYLTCLRADIRRCLRYGRPGAAASAICSAVVEDPPVALLIGASIVRNVIGSVR